MVVAVAVAVAEVSAVAVVVLVAREVDEPGGGGVLTRLNVPVIAAVAAEAAVAAKERAGAAEVLALPGKLQQYMERF